MSGCVDRVCVLGYIDRIYEHSSIGYMSWGYESMEAPTEVKDFSMSAGDPQLAWKARGMVARSRSKMMELSVCCFS